MTIDQTIEHLKERIRRSGVGTIQLAQRADIAPSTLAKLMAGNDRTTVRVIKRLEDALRAIEAERSSRNGTSDVVA